jgi:teichuronic acid biosynthesis glycosyltransferase TuaG
MKSAAQAEVPCPIPEVSVITPAFNSARTISRCLGSVQGQTFSDWEQIVIDDCSRDETVEIVRRQVADDPRVRLVTLSENSGAGPARNAGVGIARGRFVAFLDADDEWYPDKLERVIAFMKREGVSFAYHDYDIVGSGGDIRATTCAPAQMTYEELLGNTAIGCLTVVIDAQSVRVPPMPAIPLRQPLVAWLAILKDGTVARKADGVCAAYHLSKGSISSNKAKALAWTWRVYRRFEGFSRLQSMRFLMRYVYNSAVKNSGLIKRRSVARS